MYGTIADSFAGLRTLTAQLRWADPIFSRYYTKIAHWLEEPTLQQHFTSPLNLLVYRIAFGFYVLREVGYLSSGVRLGIVDESMSNFLGRGHCYIKLNLSIRKSKRMVWGLEVKERSHKHRKRPFWCLWKAWFSLAWVAYRLRYLHPCILVQLLFMPIQHCSVVKLRCGVEAGCARVSKTQSKWHY